MWAELALAHIIRSFRDYVGKAAAHRKHRQNLGDDFDSVERKQLLTFPREWG
jgi:hypothetical protein